MLRIIDGKCYDTETATLICDISPNDFHYDDFRYESTHLYLTGKGAWFMAGEGGPLSRWAQPVGKSGKCSGEGIQIISDIEARDLIEQHGKPEQVEEFFSVEDALARPLHFWPMVRDRGFVLDKVREPYWLTDRPGHPVVGGARRCYIAS